MTDKIREEEKIENAPMDNIIAIPNFNPRGSQGELTVPANNDKFYGELVNLEKSVMIFLDNYDKKEVNSQLFNELKAKRADLNRVLKNINNGRIEMSKKWKEIIDPYEEKIKSITESISLVESLYDKEIKKRENEEKNAKLEELILYYSNNYRDYLEMLPFNRILEDQWLNRTYDIDKVKKEIDKKIEFVKNGLKTINEFSLCPELKMYCIYQFLNCLDVTEALYLTKKYSSSVDKNANIIKKLLED